MLSDADNQLLSAAGERIRALRKSLDWTQEELAHQSGVTRRMIQGVEREGRNPSLLTIVKLARALNTTPSALLDGIE